MKRLTLVRHANAAWKNPQSSDYDRPLTRRGQSEATVLGRLLARGKLTPDFLISSSAQRARQTTEILARELTLPANTLRFEETLYLAEAAQILEVARSPGPKLSHLMIVGHNPCISELARQLAPRADIAELDTATACTMSFEIATWLEIAPGTATDIRLEPRSQQLPVFWP